MADVERGTSYLDAMTAKMPEAVTAHDVMGEVRELWRTGLPPGDKTGWPSIDKHYTVAKGQFTVVTGYPGSGKSEWVDALQINLARQGWRTAYYSPENMPISLHITKLAEKLSGKPFGRGPTERMTEDELAEYADEIGQWFLFLKSKTGDPVNVRSVIAAATPWLERQSEKRGLVIDPWNELEHWREKGKSETEYISEQLSYIRGWARNTNTHVWLVAHPQKLVRSDGKLPTPTPDSISGSAHFWNKADCAITVERALADSSNQEVNIHVQKVRFKHIGHAGMVTLRWDRVCGRYYEIPSLQAVKAYANRGMDD
jgi:twinkle protein